LRRNIFSKQPCRQLTARILTADTSSPLVVRGCRCSPSPCALLPQPPKPTVFGLPSSLPKAGRAVCSWVRRHGGTLPALPLPAVPLAALMRPTRPPPPPPSPLIAPRPTLRPVVPGSLPSLPCRRRAAVMLACPPRGLPWAVPSRRRHRRCRRLRLHRCRHRRRRQFLRRRSLRQ